jgi:hypothetical protein
MLMRVALYMRLFLSFWLSDSSGILGFWHSGDSGFPVVPAFPSFLLSGLKFRFIL